MKNHHILIIVFQKSSDLLQKLNVNKYFLICKIVKMNFRRKQTIKNSLKSLIKGYVTLKFKKNLIIV